MRECALLRIARICLAFLVVAATAGNSGFRFAILGDRTGETVSGVYERICRDVEAEHPAFVISVGDTIQGGDDRTAAGQWRALKPLWSRSGLPVFLSAGNHDVWSEESARIYEKQTGRPLSYSFDWDGAHFTVLDNSRTAELAPDQLSFLERDLAANASRAPKIVVFHRPFWLIYLKLGNPNFALHRILRQAGVAAVLSGHLHQFDRVQQDGVTYLSVCSSGGHLRTGDEAEDPAHGWFFGHVLGTVRDGRVSFEVRQLRR